MKSKTLIPSTKTLDKDRLVQMIHRKCKKDHFSYTKQLSIKRNQSVYTSAYRYVDSKDKIENKKIQEFRKNIAPPSLDTSLLKRSLHESSLHFSPSKVSALPSLKIGSTYQSNFVERSNEKIVKGKQRDGYFMKMSWHDSPSSNYRKSYQKSNCQISPNQKGKVVQGHLHVLKRPFNGKSVYQQCYSPLKRSTNNDSKDFIKNKDHLTGAHCTLKGESQYKSRYEKKQNKQNNSSTKSIKSKKRLSLLPEIKAGKGHSKNEHLPKKSLKMKKTQSNSVGQQHLNSTTHDRIFGVVDQN